jgi:hypothetical protein
MVEILGAPQGADGRMIGNSGETAKLIGSIAEASPDFPLVYKLLEWKKGGKAVLPNQYRLIVRARCLDAHQEFEGPGTRFSGRDGDCMFAMIEPRGQALFRWNFEPIHHVRPETDPRRSRCGPDSPVGKVGNAKIVAQKEGSTADKRSRESGLSTRTGTAECDRPSVENHTTGMKGEHGAKMKQDPGNCTDQDSLDLKKLHARRFLYDDFRFVGNSDFAANPETGNRGNVYQRTSVPADLHEWTRPKRIRNRVRRLAKTKRNVGRVLADGFWPCRE